MKPLDPSCPQHVAAFVQNSIDSVVQLELLLLLFAHRQAAWTPEAIARELRIDVTWVQTQLTQLCARGLLFCPTDIPPSFQYKPATPTLDQTVTDLAKTYADRRVSVISLIYSKPPEAQARPADPLKCFTDAFRIRKEKPHAETVYALCMVTSIAIAVLLLRGYAQSRARLLLWCALCFIALAVNNGLLFVDKVIYPATELSFLGIAMSIWRSVTALAGLLLLLWGMIWDVE